MKRNLRRKVIWAFVLLALACPGVLCGIGYYSLRATFLGPARSLPREIELARKDGIPLDPADLRPNPPIPADQNAATIYKAFFPRIERVFKEHKKLNQECEALSAGKATPEQKLDIATALDEVRDESLLEVVAAGKRPYCDFNYHYEDGPSLRFPEMTQAKYAANLIVAKADILAGKGKMVEAYDLLGEAERLATQMGQGPLLIAPLIQISIDGLISGELCRLIDRSKSDPALLEHAQKTLDGLGPLVDVKHAFRSEVVMGRITLHMIHTVGDVKASLGVDGSQSQGGSGPRLPQMVTQAFEAKFIALWRRVFENLPADRTDWMGDYNVLKKIDADVESDKSMMSTMNTVLFPMFSQICLTVGRQDASRRIAATAIRIMQDHLRTGKYPVALPNYGRISIDPFDGKPLRYKLKGNGFVIYSIDRDFEDNGGRVRKGTENSDLVREFE